MREKEREEKRERERLRVKERIVCVCIKRREREREESERERERCVLLTYDINVTIQILDTCRKDNPGNVPICQFCVCVWFLIYILRLGSLISFRLSLFSISNPIMSSEESPGHWTCHADGSACSCHMPREGNWKKGSIKLKFSDTDQEPKYVAFCTPGLHDVECNVNCLKSSLISTILCSKTSFFLVGLCVDVVSQNHTLFVMDPT